MEQYLLLNIEDIFTQLPDKKIFSKLGLKDEHCQLQLDEGSRDLVIINTHKGLFHFTVTFWHCFSYSHFPTRNWQDPPRHESSMLFRWQAGVWEKWAGTFIKFKCCSHKIGRSWYEIASRQMRISKTFHRISWSWIWSSRPSPCGIKNRSNCQSPWSQKYRWVMFLYRFHYLIC